MSIATVEINEAPAVDGKLDEQLDRVLSQEFNWLLDTIQWRWRKEFEGQKKDKPTTPPLEEETRYGQLINHFSLTEEDRLVLLLALAPFFIPNDLHETVTGSLEYKPITYGARKSIHANQFLPTGTTALFLLAESNLVSRLKAYKTLTRHPMMILTRSLLRLGEVKYEEPDTNAFLSIDMIVVNYLVGECKLSALGEPLTT